MDSLFEIQSEVESFLGEKLGDNGISLRDKLVQSSVKFDCVGCDGLLIGEVEDYIEKLLSKMSDKKMQHIWKETENGIMATAQGSDEADRCMMIHDIILDLKQEIADYICRVAREILKKKKKSGW